MLHALYAIALLAALFGTSLAAFGPAGIFLSVLVVLLLLPLLLSSTLARAIAYTLLILLFIALLLPAFSAARMAARRMLCTNNLKQLGLALFNYQQQYKCFPPPVVTDADGKPMHSWRTLILPYLERHDLYEAFDFDEPWDGPKNKKLLGLRFSTYTCPSDETAIAPNATTTSYLAIVRPGTAWSLLAEGGDDMKTSISKGDSILLVEVAGSNIAWTEPRDIDVDKLHSPGSPKISSRHMRDNGYFYHPTMSGANVAMCDGSVRFLPAETFRTAKLKELLSVGGCTEENMASAGEPEELRFHWTHCLGLCGWIVSIVLSLDWIVRTRKLLHAKPAHNN